MRVHVQLRISKLIVTREESGSSCAVFREVLPVWAERDQGSLAGNLLRHFVFSRIGSCPGAW